VGATAAAVWQDGRYAGSVPLPATGPVGGRVLLGISVQNGDDSPPYAVTFTDLDLRTR
jgi:hypothetical protein